tara:strand:- start:4 stop:513 length:510 start_codon:yes stop_codon:yes gene_type:complete
VKIGGKIRYRPDGTPMPEIATPVFGYKSHISIDRRFGFIRKAAVTSAAHSDGRQLRCVIDTSNTAGDVWADSAYRSQKNETWLARNMLTSRIHRRKPKDQPMPGRIARAKCREIGRAGKGRAHLCAPEEPLWVIHLNHWARQGAGQTYAGQPGLQFRPRDLPRAAAATR